MEESRTISINMGNCCLRILEFIDDLPAGLFRAVDTLGDRLVAKAPQLISNKTTNICENFMSIRCKMDGGKYFNHVQSGSFHHRCMAAALRVQCGPNWIAHIWKTLFHSVGKHLRWKHTVIDKNQLFQNSRHQMKVHLNIS